MSSGTISGSRGRLRFWVSVLACMPVLAVASLPPAPVCTPTVRRAVLGVEIADQDNSAAPTKGAVISKITAGGVAEHAGLLVGDAVLRVGGRPTEDFAALRRVVTMIPIGTRAPVQIRRHGMLMTVTAHFTAVAESGQLISGDRDEDDVDARHDAQAVIQEPALRQTLLRLSGLQPSPYRHAQTQWLHEHGVPFREGDAMLVLDQGVGHEYTEFVSHLKPDDFEPGAPWNVACLKQIIAAHGWPTVSMVGLKGAHGAGLIAVAAEDDPEFQARALALMEPLVGKGEVRKPLYAALFDIVHPTQRYGMVGECGSPTKPLEDPEHVDERRASMDLPPMSVCFRVGDLLGGKLRPITGTGKAWVLK